MTVTTRGGKWTIDQPMLYVVEDEVRNDEEVVGTSAELLDKAAKKVEVP